MNKKRIGCLFLSFCLYCIWGIQAQEKVSGQTLLSDILQDIEAQTNYRIFYNEEDIKDVEVQLYDPAEDPVETLKKRLENKNLYVTVLHKMIFITKDVAFFTDWSIIAPEEKTMELGADTINVPVLRKKEVKATSENLVYSIGSENEYRESQIVTIRGNVSDFKTREPMAGINIYIKEPLIGTTTDAFGYFTLKIPSGRRELNIQGIGVKSTTRQLQVFSDGLIDIELEEQVHNLREVIVSSERMANVRGTVLGLEKLKVADIKNIPTAFGETDIMRVVMTLPGVKAVGEISSGYNVRGGATDQNLILFNEGTIYNPTHLFGLFSVFNPDIVRDMEFYKSSIPVKYGGRISSVLDINSKEGNKKEFSGSASIGLLTSRVTFEMPLIKEKTSLILGARTTYSDWILKQLPERSGYNNGNAGFSDFNALLSHKINENNNLYLSGYFSQDYFNFDMNEKYSYRNGNASIKWRHLINPNFSSVYTFGYDHYDFNTKDSEIPANAYKLSFDINQAFGKADYKLSIADSHTLSFGLNAMYYALNPGTYKPEGEASQVKTDKIQEEKALESALYIGDVWDVSSKFSVDYGVRMSMFNVLGSRTYNLYDPTTLPSLSSITETVTDASGVLKTYWGPEFRLSARYAFTNDFSIKAGANTMRQNIHKISNSTIMSPTDTWKLSDMNIKPQTGLQTSVGLYKNFNDGMYETSVEGYYKKMDDYLDYKSGAVLVMNHNLEVDVINTKGRAYGVEFMVKKTRGKLNGWLSYTYSKTELRQNDKRIPSPINNGDWYPADFDKPHDIKLIGNYKFTHRHSLSINCEYNTGRPITLPASKFEYEGKEYVYYDRRNAARIPDYFRVDASFNIEPSHNLTLLTHSTISFGVYNVTGRKNVYSVYYLTDYKTLNGYKMSVFGIPIPYVSYNIKF